jgi:hypothetical protein
LWQPHAENTASSFSVLDDLFNLQPPYLAYAREKRPLIGPRHEGAVENDGVVLLARALLERQSNQVPKPSLRNRVLIRKQAIVRVETDIRTSLHGLGEDMRSQPARKRGWNGLFKEKPDVSASPRA